MYCTCCHQEFRASDESREGTPCTGCGSTSRDRYMAFAVVAALGELSKDATDRELRIVGVSDGAILSAALTRMFGDSYRNHQFHTEPFLDLCAVSPDMYQSADIVTCSEVLEHVPNPVSRAFEGLAALLVPDGVAVLSVPHYSDDEPHREHFPPLTDTFIDRTAPHDPVYVGVDETGTERRYSELVFHGGEGATLEHRIYSRSSFAEKLLDAGFSRAHPLMRNHSNFGASWEPWSRVWIAIK